VAIIQTLKTAGFAACLALTPLALAAPPPNLPLPPTSGQIVAPTQPRVLVNQVGYDRLGQKRAIVQGFAGDRFTAFKVVNADTGAVVLTGVPESAGAVPHWQDWRYWTIDFSAVEQAGLYRVEAEGSHAAVSFPFWVANDALKRYTLSDVLYYFKGQRASGDFDRADAHLPRPAGTGTVYLSGGWYDATGDYGIHLAQTFVGAPALTNQDVSFAVWGLASAWRNLEARHDQNFAQYERRLIDEATFGADFLVRDRVPGGSFYPGISAPGVDKLAADRQVSLALGQHFGVKTDPEATNLPMYQKQAPRAAALKPVNYEVGFRSGGGMAIAGLAVASTLPGHGAFTSQQYLATAEAAYRFLAAHNAEVLDDGTPDIVDDFTALVAATELYRATRSAAYRTAADAWAQKLMARLTTAKGFTNYWRADANDRPFFSASDAGLPVVALVDYAGIAEPAARAAAIKAIRRSLAFELATTADVNNPFGYARQLITLHDGAMVTRFFMPHDTAAAPWWQGENARLGSLAAAARMAAPLFADDAAFQQKLRGYADDQLDWILGLNPYDTSMLIGAGDTPRNGQYLFFNSWEYTSAPGAVINGFTAAMDSPDATGIAFNLGYATTRLDNDWRWTEQWVPHDAWFLYAVSLPQR
jgi:hypothetical protein